MIFLSCEMTIPSKKRQIYMFWLVITESFYYRADSLRYRSTRYQHNLFWQNFRRMDCLHLLNLLTKLDSMGCLLTFKRIFLIFGYTIYIYLYHVCDVYGILHGKKPANTQLLIYLQQYFFGFVIWWSFSVCVWIKVCR